MEEIIGKCVFCECTVTRENVYHTCGIVKPRRPKCISCGRDQKNRQCANSRDANRARSKRHYQANRERYKAESNQKYHAARAAMKEPTKRQLLNALYSATKEERMASRKARRTLRDTERRKTNIKFRLRCLFAGRIREALKRGYKKAASTIALIGCDVDTARAYIEADFAVGMTWQNHGTIWQLDHRIPVSVFNMANEDQQRRAFHYTNLRPMFKAANLRKSDFIPGTNLRARDCR